MGGAFSGILGLDSASEKLSDALLQAEANATGELRNVALTAINYVKSFTPIISLLMVFLALLLLVGILSILNRMLADLEVDKTVRYYTVLVISILLYIWFVAIQVSAAVKQKGATSIVIASMASLVLVAMIVLTILFARRGRNTSQKNSDLAGDEMKDVQRKDRQIHDSSNTPSRHSMGKKKIFTPSDNADY
ncbi:unnamed protein product [Adineta steineri]|uniref:Uncharacterized protein n=1 Tax=Adineta steineri TaxID=433720 RepID=A0A814JVE3_9BILA|nr:unnamed protein product [Adineta steineri]CAF1256062.1 unnamed protein product [Adineta steineri]